MAGRHQQQSKFKVRIMAVFLLLLQIGLGFTYGFGAQFDTRTTFYPSTQDNSNSVILYILPAILAILGWGLIIAYSQNSAIAGLMTTLITVGLFVQLGPPLKAFWQLLYTDNLNYGRLDIGILHQAEIMYAVTSMMIAFCFVSGRIGLVQTIIINVIYCGGWHANYQLIYWMKNNKFTNEIENTDSVGGNSVYLFAAVVGIIVSSFLECKPGRTSKGTGSRQSALIALMGTGFVFAASPFSGIQAATIFGAYTFPLNVYFTLTSSIVVTYCSSALFGQFKVGIRQSIVGVLGGISMIASVASYINNIGACLAIGAAAGFVSGFWLRVIHPKINENHRYDHLGLIGTVLVNSVIGCGIVAPTVFGAYKNLGTRPNQLNSAVTNERSSTYYLTIFGISLGIAILTGIIAGILCWIFRNPADDFHYTKLVSDDFGLYNQFQKKEVYKEEVNPSAQHLHNKNPGTI